MKGARPGIVRRQRVAQLSQPAAWPVRKHACKKLNNKTDSKYRAWQHAAKQSAGGRLATIPRTPLPHLAKRYNLVGNLSGQR